MKKILATLWLWCLFMSYSHAQVTVSPAIFTADQAVTLTYDATQSQGQQLANLPAATTTITAHVGAILVAGGTSWTNVPGVWGNPASTPKFTRQGTSNIYTLSLPNGVRSMFTAPAIAPPSTTPIFRIGMVLRENGPCGGFGGNSTACKEGKNTSGSDIFIDVNQGTLDIAFSAPTNNGFFVNTGDNINITATTNLAANITIEVNGTSVNTGNSVTTLSHTVNVVAGTDVYSVKAKATAGTVNVEKTIYFIRRKATPISNALPTYALYPSTIFPKIGINYSPTNNKEVTAVFRAPNKDKMYVIGDFNNWELNPTYQMNRTDFDGTANDDFYWVTFEVPTAGVEYTFQYQIYNTNETFDKTADPYSEKILDPWNDEFISATTYPNPTPYPTGKTTGIVSVLQTNQTPYTWSSATLNFQRPPKEKLVIYELWVHDFSQTRDFQGVIDRLDYLQGLGVNAIQFMPMMEFSGNISWGYNTNFYFAVDKAYGTKNKFKELVDKCHQRGMAVILDMVLNHAQEEFPYVKIYPANANPWFNQTATHPFSVFRDFNHDSQLTKNLVKDVNLFWLDEFKVDGFRFDLSKGFTQNAQCANKEDVGCWNQYHADRVATWKRIADEIWAVHPEDYVILEHLSENAEEAELGNYRWNETPRKGMMFWRNMERNFAENLMGYNNSTADISGSDYGNNAGWQAPRLIPYMESHDEQRVMYSALTNGNNAIATHNVRTVPIAMDRAKGLAAMCFLSTGPKMIWQFGEMGFDFHINRCPDGTIGTGTNCRTDSKPLPWVAPQNYDTQPDRVKLRKAYSEIVKLKTTYDTFGSFDTFIESSQDGSQYKKQLKQTSSPYTASPTSGNNMNVVVIANFDVASQNVRADFHHEGTWYDFFSGSADAPYSVTGGTSKSINLKAGEFRIFTNFPITAPEAELTAYALPAKVGNLVATAISDTQIKLDWTDASGIETGYRIERSTTLNGTYTQVGSNLASGTTTFTDNGLNSGTQYFYRVVTLSTNGNKNSVVVNATTTAPVIPNAPTSLTAIASTTVLAINLAWTDASNNETGFRVQRKTGAAGTYATIADNLPANTTTYTDNTSLTEGTTYFYRVFSVIGSQSAGSNEASAVAPTIIPLAPTNIQVTAPANAKALNLTWTDNATNETSYRVERALGTGTFAVIANSLPANTTSYNDTDASLVIGQTYTYRVCAVLGSQTGCANSTPTTVTSAQNRLFEQSIELYPNPTQNTISLKLENKGGKAVEIRLLDLRGKEVRTFEAITEEKLEINLEALPKGTYMLELRTEKGTATKRIVKN
jgi:glycosidase